MSVENFAGDGLGDQPSIVYGFERTDRGEVEVRELCRSGYGEPGPSPGDVIERERTKSSLDTQLPVLDIPGQEELARDDCGEDIPAFACVSEEGCGNPVYVGRTCASPECERDWPAAVKSKVIRAAGKLEGLRRALYARHDGNKDVDFNHVVASLPSLLVDSEEPLERALLIIKELLENHWDVAGFIAIYHPWRIKQEYRKDQYDHGGEAGDGDMTWGDVLSEDDPYQYLTHDPHFHLFFPAVRKSFDYLTAEGVEEESGWMFHRITKEDSNVSVSDLDDLVHQLTYSFSHAGLREVADRTELASRMKGELHNCYIPDGVEDEVLASFCSAAPRLLGTRFTNLNEATCSAEIADHPDTDSDTDTEEATSEEATSVDVEEETPSDHPLYDVLNPGGSSTSTVGEGDPFESDVFEAGTGPAGDVDEWEHSPSQMGRTAMPIDSDSDSASQDGGESDSETESDSPLVDRREHCEGTLKPIREAAERLEDSEWCQQAEYVSHLRTAVEEWERLSAEEADKPWTGDDEEYPGVVQRD